MAMHVHELHAASTHAPLVLQVLQLPAHAAAVEAVLQGEKHPWEGPTLSKQTRVGG